MNTRFLFPYWCRYVGWSLVILHIPATMLGRANGMVNVMDNGPASTGLFSGVHLFFICTSLVMVSGLFLVAFAKEKVEDEQIWHIRLDSLRWAIYVNYIILIISLVFIEDVAHMLDLNLYIPLIFFIVRFRWVIFRLNSAVSREGQL